MTHNQNVFSGVAYYYARYRRGYPENFYQYLQNSFSLTRNSRALDLGAGTGQIAFELAERVGEVTAVDINPEMIAEGERIAQEKGIKNIAWLVSGAEEVPSTLGMFDIVTIGSAFHWMDGDVVLNRVYEMTNRNGGIAIVANTNSIHRNNEGSVWKQVAREVIEKYVGKDRKAGKTGLYQEPKDRFEDIIDRSRFVGRESFAGDYEEKWTIDEIIGYLHSTSFASAEVLGDKWSAFEAEVREKLQEINSEGAFLEKQTLEAIVAYRR